MYRETLQVIIEDLKCFYAENALQEAYDGVNRVTQRPEKIKLEFETAPGWKCHHITQI